MSLNFGPVLGIIMPLISFPTRMPTYRQTIPSHGHLPADSFR